MAIFFFTIYCPYTQDYELLYTQDYGERYCVQNFIPVDKVIFRFYRFLLETVAYM